MTISVRDLAHAVNTCSRLPIESGMTTWEIDVLNQYCHIVDRSYHTGWFQEEAEALARKRCADLHESSWQVLPIRKEE